MERVLVTGGAGFIGSAIARALLERGDDVRIIDNLLTGERERLPADAELVEADLRDVEATTKACKGIDVVIHQAALRSVPKSVDNPLLATECNILGTLNVLLAAQSSDVRRVVYASSSSAYGDTAEPIQREDAPTNPASPYAASKLAGEHYCRVWTKVHSLPTVSLRYFNVFGPGQNPESLYAAVFPAFVSSLLTGTAPVVQWDGEQTRDFSYIDDVVRANLAAAEADEKRILDMGGAVVNIGGGHPRTINEVLRTVADAVGTWIEPERVPRRAGDIRSTHADISRAADLLGWRPQAEWSRAVEETVSYLRGRV